MTSHDSVSNTRRPHPLNAYPHFFIIGAQRFGTTLLRLILNSHSKIAIPEETAFLYPYLKKDLLLSKVPTPFKRKKTFFDFVANDPQFAKWNIEIDLAEMLSRQNLTFQELVGSLYYSFCRKHGKVICGDKTPKFIRKISTLAECYPQSKFIHIMGEIPI